MSLATGRQKRVNAGSKMSKLIDNEEEDEFYATCYGGFAEVDDDKDFIEKTEDHEEDYVDSDFDIDENEEPEAENNEDDEIKRRRPTRGVFTKSYKEPSSKVVKVKTEESVKKESKQLLASDASNSTEIKENKILRNTTAQKRKELEDRQKEREASQKLKSKKSAKPTDDGDIGEYRRLTQEELLSEAKVTEEINLASLDAYQKLELEKKKMKSQKHAIRGPLIRYHSVTMPLIDIDEEMYGDQNETSEQKYSRNFIIFPDEDYVNNLFDNEKPEVVKPQKCAVTGLPAKYFDPLTNMPYANIFAFKKLREIYEIAKVKAEKAEKAEAEKNNNTEKTNE